MAWDVAENLKALRVAIRKWRPKATIYTIGDAAHQRRTSDHNPDDTSGSAAEQSDSDSKAEVRALDVMLTAGFSAADAMKLITTIIADPAARKRLRYMIFNHKIYSAKNGWKPAPFESDPHTDHVHISNLASDDGNTAPWPAVLALSGEETDVPLTAADLLEVRKQVSLGLYDIAWAMAKNTDVKTSSGAVISEKGRADATEANLLALFVAPVLKAIADTDTANDKADALTDATNDAAAKANHDAEMAALADVPGHVADAVVDLPTADLVELLRDGLGDGWADFKSAVAAS